MKNKELLNLLDEVQLNNPEVTQGAHDRVLLLDGLNLFFRNFAMMNMVNPDGIHIGGLGGFLRSLGAMIRQIQPTSVYVVFDGPGSTANRKNIIPEYKGGRNIKRVTNFDIFDSHDEEHDSKIDQIVRVIQYLKFLPVKTIIIPKVEADDIIAVLSKKFEEDYGSNVFIVSSDKDFTQIVTNKVVLYRPMEKMFYNAEKVHEKYKVLAENFIIYKTLLGDNSDNLHGIKGLGEKGIFKKFPELTERKLSLDDIWDIAEAKFKDHVVYARILQDFDKLEKSYKIMDLSNPMIDDKGIQLCSEVIEEELPSLNIEYFTTLYNEDKLGGMIRNLEYWLKDVFSGLEGYKK